MSAPVWFTVEDVDARITFGCWFDHGVLLWRIGEPVLYSDDATASELCGYPWRSSSRIAWTMEEAIAHATEIAENERHSYSLREEDRGGGIGRPKAIERARLWLAAQPSSKAGEAGDRTLARAAVTLVRGFCLEPDGAAAVLLEEYDRRSEPPWGADKRRRVLVWAEKHGRMPWAAMLDQSGRGFLDRGRGAGRGNAAR